MIKIKEEKDRFVLEGDNIALLIQAIGNDHFWKDWHEHHDGRKHWGLDVIEKKNIHMVSKKSKDKVISRDDVIKTAESRGISVEFI